MNIWDCKMVGFYFLMLTFVALVAYAGYDETMRLFAYLDLQIRYAFVKTQMKWMGWKLKRQLIKDTTDFEKFLKEYKDGE
jgi:hypothetical protein